MLQRIKSFFTTTEKNALIYKKDELFTNNCKNGIMYKTFCAILLPFQNSNYNLSTIFNPMISFIPHLNRPLLPSLFKSLYVAFFYPFKIGDNLKIKEFAGNVVDINMRFVVLKKDNKYVFVPVEKLYGEIFEIERKKQLSDDD